MTNLYKLVFTILTLYLATHGALAEEQHVLKKLERRALQWVFVPRGTNPRTPLPAPRTVGSSDPNYSFNNFLYDISRGRNPIGSVNNQYPLGTGYNPNFPSLYPPPAAPYYNPGALYPPPPPPPSVDWPTYYYTVSDEGINVQGRSAALSSNINSAGVQIDLFVRGAGNALYVKQWGVSSSWTIIPGMNIFSNPAAAATSTTKYVFGRSSGNTLLYASSTSGISYGTVTAYGANFIGNPTAVTSQGVVYAFIRDSSNSIVQIQGLPSSLTASSIPNSSIGPFSSDPAAAAFIGTNSNVYLVIVACGVNNLPYAYVITNSVTGTWTQLSARECADGPVAVSLANSMSVYVRNLSDGRFYTYTYNGVYWSTGTVTVPDYPFGFSAVLSQNNLRGFYTNERARLVSSNLQ